MWVIDVGEMCVRLTRMLDLESRTAPSGGCANIAKSPVLGGESPMES